MSSQQKRFKRAEPTQHGPLRNPAGERDFNKSRPFSDSMDSAVRTAYTVIDDYMRRGQEAASRYCGNYHQYNDQYNSFGGVGMNDDWNRDPWSSGPPPFGPSSPLMWQMTEAMRTWMTLFYSAYRMPPGGGWGEMPPDWTGRQGHYSDGGQPTAATQGPKSKPTAPAAGPGRLAMTGFGIRYMRPAVFRWLSR